MTIVAKGLGVAVMVFGLLIFAFPGWTSKIFEFFKERLYVAGIIRLAAGAVLLTASPDSWAPPAAMALGALFLVSGLIVFTTDPVKLKAFMVSYSQLPAGAIRLFGLVGACFGVLTYSIFP